MCSCHTEYVAVDLSCADCQHLLVLAGPTYATRLWCVLELYAFVVVRPKLDGLVIRPFANVGPLASGDLYLAFGGFDAEKSKCYLEDDRHSLLAVIESGFGSIPAFNKRLLCVIASINEPQGGTPCTPTPQCKTGQVVFSPLV